MSVQTVSEHFSNPPDIQKKIAFLENSFNNKNIIIIVVIIIISFLNNKPNVKGQNYKHVFLTIKKEFWVNNLPGL